MAIPRRTVREELLYHYALLIADAVIDKRDSLQPAVRQGSRYWAFVNKTYRQLLAGELSPSGVLTENKQVLLQGDACAYCGAAGALHWEHLIPKALGGPDSIDNLVRACPSCNRAKGARDPVTWYREQGRPKREIPRLVMGKVLKLVLVAHERRGTLDHPEYPAGSGSLSLLLLCGVFGAE